MKRLIFLLTLALSFAPAGATAQTPDELNIAVLVDQAPPEVAEVFRRLREEIVALVGRQATVRMDPADIRTNGFDPDRARQQYADMLEDDTDLILAFGPASASAIADRSDYPKPTILFGGVVRDLEDLPEPGATSGITNFTYVVAPEFLGRDLRTLKGLYDFQRLGIVVPEGPLEALGLDERLPGLMAELGADFEVIGYTSPSDVEAAVDRLDAVYLLESRFIPAEEIRAIAGLLTAAGVPSFSGSRREDVELGIMASNQPRGGLDSFLRRIALRVESVVNGEDLADQPVHFEVTSTLTVNFNTARAVGVPIRYSLIATTDFVGDFHNPVAERRYTLTDLVEEVLAANPGLEAAREGVRIAQQDRRSAFSNYLPALSANLTQIVLDEDLAAASSGRNPQYTTSGLLSVTQVAFSPQANAAISVQGSLLDAERAALTADEWDLVLEAASAYFTALILKANVEIQARNLDATKRSLRIARESFEAGQSGRSDILRLESEAARDMQSLVDAVNALDQGFHAINQLVDQPVDREIDVLDASAADGAFTDADFEVIRGILDDPSLREPFEDWLALEAMANSPELRIFDHNIDAVNRNVRVNGLERFLPTVAAGLDLNRIFAQEGAGAPPAGLSVDEYFSLGVTASIPLFDSNQRRIARQTGLFQRNQLEAERQDARNAIERAVRDVVLDLTGEIAGIQLSSVSEAAAQESLELAQASFASGAITVVQLLDAQSNYLSAQLARASATYSFLATSVALQRLVGHFSMLRTPEENAAFQQRFQTFLQARTQGGRP